jgi:hypothetical protein
VVQRAAWLILQKNSRKQNILKWIFSVNHSTITDTAKNIIVLADILSVINVEDLHEKIKQPKA